MGPNALSCICAYTDAQVNEPAAPCAEKWPIMMFSTVYNFGLIKLAYNVGSKVHVDLKSTI